MIRDKNNIFERVENFHADFVFFSSASSRRKRESHGNLIEYQEFEELFVRKKREEAAAAVETEEEMALRSYGSRLRSFPVTFVVLRVFQAS